MKKKKGHLRLPHVPNRIERMWMAFKGIQEWNRMGGVTIYVDPSPDAIDQWRRMKREVEKKYIKYHKAEIKESRIGWREAIRRIWAAGRRTRK